MTAGISPGNFEVEVQVYGGKNLTIRLLLSRQGDLKKAGSSVPARSAFVCDAVYNYISDVSTASFSAIGCIHGCVKVQSKAEDEALYFINCQSNLGKMPSMHQGDSPVPPSDNSSFQLMATGKACEIVTRISCGKVSNVLGQFCIPALSGNFSPVVQGKMARQSFKSSLDP